MSPGCDSPEGLPHTPVEVGGGNPSRPFLLLFPSFPPTGQAPGEGRRERVGLWGASADMGAVGKNSHLYRAQRALRSEMDQHVQKIFGGNC